MNEAESLRQFLTDDNNRDGLYLPGDSCGGWTVVDRIHLGDKRWTKLYKNVVLSAATGDYYAFLYEEGLTEYQEGYYHDDDVAPVYKRTRMVEITEWLDADK